MTARTTTRTARTAKTVVAEPVREEAHAAHEVFGNEEMSLGDKVKLYLRMQAEAYGASSLRAYICGVVAAFFVQSGVTYALWSVMSTLSIAMLLVSGSMFIATVVGIIGLLLSLIVGGVAGTYVMKYIASGTAGRHLDTLKNSVLGIFGSKREVAAC